MQKILAGKEASLFYKQEIKKTVEELRLILKRPPTLAIVIPSVDDASMSYLKSREKQATDLGIHIVKYVYPTIDKPNLIALVQQLNLDVTIDGIIIDRPFPKGIDENEIYDYLDLKKDADGCSAFNAGRLMHGRPSIYPSTARAVVELLKYYQVALQGLNIVVIGRSKIVGMPVSKMLLDQNATVTICHSKTKNLVSICKQADVLVVAMGKKNFVNLDFVNPRSIVIDVGIHYDNQNGICGDVDKSVYDNVSKYSPVPGGVGPLTSIMLFDNVLKLMKMR